MKVVYIHFHLKTSGVTTVLTQQVNAVRHDADVLVIAGTPPENSLPADTAVVEGLGYDDAPPDGHKAIAVAESIMAAVHEKWKDGCDLIHIHNATLAKNRNLLQTLRLLQRQGVRLFIQIHDFAEDGRPSVYFQDEYPRDCHYGVINSRDYRILLKSGLKPTGLHKLFNVIQARGIAPAEKVPGKWILYPVRALRRKNIGEAILLSLFFPPENVLGVTLPPNSPADIQSYEGWKAFVRRENLTVCFDAGVDADFTQLIVSAKLMVTTSVMEGFGFAFLEPWAAGKYLWGRKLPEICRDFEENGIDLDHLYSRLNVPLDWIDRDAFFQRRHSCAALNSRRFNFAIDPNRISREIQQSVAGRMVDFGILDEKFQKLILSRIIRSPAERNRLIKANPWLRAPGKAPDLSGLIRRNHSAVCSAYNEKVYRQRLLEIYQQVLHTPVRHHIDKPALLSQFFDPSSFSLLTWGEYVE